jgi:hypothetical protein
MVSFRISTNMRALFSYMSDNTLHSFQILCCGGFDYTSRTIKTFLKLHMSSREIIKNEKLIAYLHSRNPHFRLEGRLKLKIFYET